MGPRSGIMVLGGRPVVENSALKNLTLTVVLFWFWKYRKLQENFDNNITERPMLGLVMLHA